MIEHSRKPMPGLEVLRQRNVRLDARSRVARNSRRHLEKRATHLKLGKTPGSAHLIAPYQVDCASSLGVFHTFG
jgi:hypothetical protein